MYVGMNGMMERMLRDEDYLFLTTKSAGCELVRWSPLGCSIALVERQCLNAEEEEEEEIPF